MRASNAEEAGNGVGDPWEVFTQLVILVVEGRTPGGERGYRAGPHCPITQQPIGHRHICNFNAPTCIRADKLVSQLRLMWGAGVGVSVEVLLAPDCDHGKSLANTLDTASAPSNNLRLLEQWNFSFYDHKIPDSNANGWSLVAAVRSYLHFSQLSAWLNSSGGSKRLNVFYRLTPISFCNKFESSPQIHNFPVATIGHDTSIKVMVKAIHRTGKIPLSICPERHRDEEESSNNENSYPPKDENLDLNQFRSYYSPTSSKEEFSRTEEDLRRSMMKAKLTDVSFIRRSESPDTQLGESLLDPPNSLSRLPRRFQSPSRSGSPSLETPEHLLCKLKPGPSHARPPDNSLYRPYVIPPAQTLNPFQWTRTCFPSFHQNLFNPNQNIGNMPRPVFGQDSQFIFHHPPSSLFGSPIWNVYSNPTNSSNISLDSPPSIGDCHPHSDYYLPPRTSSFMQNVGDNDENIVEMDFETIVEETNGKKLEQGTKRKVEYKGEIQNKRESPPHIFEHKQPPHVIDDQLRPSCSLPGKHLCTEDLSEICDKTAEAVDIMPKTSQIIDRPCDSKSFCLTNREKKEILNVLRQNTPVPPLRINRDFTMMNSEEYILDDKLKKNTEKYKWKNIDGRKQIEVVPKVSGKVDQELVPSVKPPDKGSGPSTSSNKCDTSFKNSINICHVVPNSSNGLKRKNESERNDNSSDSKCVQAKTITQKTKYFMVKSHPTPSPKQMSRILCKTPQHSVKRSSPNLSDQEDEEPSKVKRCLQFTDVKQEKDEENSVKLQNKSECREGFTKSESLLKRLMKPKPIKPPSPIEIEPKVIKEDKIDIIAKELIRIKREREEFITKEDHEVEDICRSRCVPIPTTNDKNSFRRSLDSAANMVFHSKTGLPLTSSPAPMRRGNSFDYDSSLTSVAAIKCALYSCDDEEVEKQEKQHSPTSEQKFLLSLSAPATVTCSNLLGSFEESVLNGRLEPYSTVQGFSAEIAASGSFCPKHVTKPVTVFFYTLCDNYQMSSPYMGHINLGKKGYQVPNRGTIQVTLFNPHGTVVKMFVVMYDLSDMPPNSKTFLRQKTLNMPVGETDSHPDAHQWLRYLIHLRFASSKSNKIYLHTDVRMVIFRKSDMDAALLHQTETPYEVRSFTHGPINPKFSPRK